MAARRNVAGSKRERLTQAAVDLAHRQGFRKTTLAEIASESGVPLGNVYYYFKTRDDVGEAILSCREDQAAQQQLQFDQLPEPRARLAAFIDSTVANAAMVSQYGCPMGSLSAEMMKEGGHLAELSRSLFATPLAWMEAQFRAMGCKDDAGDLALQLLASLQGAMLLTHSFHEPSILQREGARLIGWLEAI
ncbi:hypothetical protein VW23_013910 [Devosia insulae DS-56]|uniref:HTH tetR-type domain-containing protein n=1 Tax=Devosia insulae DS-56 TaxID=1116389 RepID=A0A1E5XTL2_9HYPH|nr:TetR/AcrR family transcriptional regulator [Devosia insulae]OEO31937.1 hypothetical protein VW23_013910 [Devosia insulae DS-56]